MRKDEDIVYWNQVHEIGAQLVQWGFALVILCIIGYVISEAAYQQGYSEARLKAACDFYDDCNGVACSGGMGFNGNNTLFITQPDTNGHST